ncbi:hypothetical protein Krac_4899 [Ktedonobacter racemifer DSM 44963]|uniref:Uncharacterized protein n=1 Tax=Ktedonobacter racemifer DSM 44963 TaxID=485913 RepID=D6TTZ5_KTERA|nr:hypothetical protein Krac_4899 [Ktedonobacter racemifer DSM 44963]
MKSEADISVGISFSVSEGHSWQCGASRFLFGKRNILKRKRFGLRLQAINRLWTR